MLTREDDIEVHALARRGWTISAIARHLGRDRKTIRAYLNGREPGVRKNTIGGLVLGGWLIEHHSWHWIFLINLPIGLLAIGYAV